MRKENRDGRERSTRPDHGGIIGASIEVHKTVGPGLLESAYEVCLAFELRKLGYKFEQQKPLAVI
jgi:GxxExxY protein